VTPAPWSSIGRPVGGHAYPARGSFSLYLCGRPAALSPGSPHAYTDPDYRGWMHTSRSQNAVLIDETDQAQWEAPGLRRVHGEILHWEADADTVLVQGRHAGYLEDLGILCTRTIFMQAGSYYLVHDLVDAARATEDHVARWSIQAAAPMQEVEARACVAAGLMRIDAGWPDTIDSIDMSSEGKAVWPAADEEGRGGTYRQLHQVRWCTNVRAEGNCRFLMLIQPDPSPFRLGLVNTRADQLAVEVKSPAGADTLQLPITP
jgi:hypothetical protein